MKEEKENGERKRAYKKAERAGGGVPAWVWACTFLKIL